MSSALWFPIASLLEIAGCFSFWAWLRLDKSALWLVPGMIALASFAWVLTLVDTHHAGRVYAAYGGIYIVASLLWGLQVEKQSPAVFDLVGAGLCLVGASVIFLGPNWLQG